MPKKKYQVIKNTTSETVRGVSLGGKNMKFGKNGTFVVGDEGLAREIDKTHGRKGSQQVAVVPYRDKETNEPGHRYTFASDSRWANAWAAFEKRRQKRERRTASNGGR